MYSNTGYALKLISPAHNLIVLLQFCCYLHTALPNSVASQIVYDAVQDRVVIAAIFKSTEYLYFLFSKNGKYSTFGTVDYVAPDTKTISFAATFTRSTLLISDGYLTDMWSCDTIL